MSVHSDYLKCEVSDRKYKLETPEGGWGYVITFALSVMFCVTVGSLSAFGIIYGDFLRTIGDEASATTILFSVFNTTCCFMGLISNHLLKKNSYRRVGVTGGLIYFTGHFLTIFATSFPQMIMSFGFIQGIGFGLLLPASFGSFNEYFVVKRNFMMGISQMITSAVVMVIPLIAKYFMDQFGYRGTVAIFAAISLNATLSMVTLQPVQYHMRKVCCNEHELLEISNQKESNGNFPDKVNMLTEEQKTLFQNQINKNDKIPMKLLSEIDDNNVPDTKKNKFWRSLSEFFEVSLLKDIRFVNIAFGISFSFMSDVMFLSLLPMILLHLDFSKSEIAYTMTLVMGADLVGRMLLSILTGILTIKTRYIFLIGTMVTVVLRIGFITISGYAGQMVMCILIGAIRCTIQVLPPLVLAEHEPEKFTAAFGMYLTICGVISLLLGPFSTLATSMTEDDSGLIHSFTLLLLLCGIPWIIEIVYDSVKKRRTSRKNTREFKS